MGAPELSIWEEMKAELAGLEKSQLRRQLRLQEMRDASAVTQLGRPLLNFSSNDYLGLSSHPQVLESVQQVISHWGVGATSSRLLAGHTIVHQDLEQALAQFMQMEAALVFPSGYMANLGTLTTLCTASDAIIMDRYCHASLIDGARMSGARLFVYAHGELAEAEKALKRAVKYRRRILITESLFSMDGDVAPLSELSRLARRYGATTLVDEAHALGVFGPAGRGLRQPGEWDIVIGTLSKALGSQGGFVCGPQILIDKLISRSRSFIYTTGLAPVCAAAAHAALSLIQEDKELRQRVIKTSGLLRQRLADLQLLTLGSQSQIVPILVGASEEALRIAQSLELSGIYAPAIRPPTVSPGGSRIRFSVTAAHTEEHVDQLMNALKKEYH